MKRTNKEDCPYCAHPDLFGEVLNLEPVPMQGVSGQRVGSYFRRMAKLSANFEWVGMPGKEELRGEWHVITYQSKELALRLAGFTVQMIGKDKLGNARMNAPDPFFISGFQRPDDGGPFILRTFFAFRASHKGSSVLIDVHWWPSHDRVVTLRGIPESGASSQDLKAVNEILKLLRKETRGGGTKIEKIKVLDTIQQLGDNATQEKVAHRLGVSLRGLQKWIRKQAGSWAAIKDEAAKTEFV